MVGLLACSITPRLASILKTRPGQRAHLLLVEGVEEDDAVGKGKIHELLEGEARLLPRLLQRLALADLI